MERHNSTLNRYDPRRSVRIIYFLEIKKGLLVERDGLVAKALTDVETRDNLKPVVRLYKKLTTFKLTFSILWYWSVINRL